MAFGPTQPTGNNESLPAGGEDVQTGARRRLGRGLRGRALCRGRRSQFRFRVCPFACVQAEGAAEIGRPDWREGSAEQTLQRDTRKRTDCRAPERRATKTERARIPRRRTNALRIFGRGTAYAPRRHLSGIDWRTALSRAADRILSNAQVALLKFIIYSAWKHFQKNTKPNLIIIV